MAKEGRPPPEGPKEDSNLSDPKVYEESVLYGLKKIKRMGEVQNVPLRISNMRKLRERFNLDIYRAFVHFGLKHVVPSNVWNIGKSQCRISNIFTIQDEAFVLILFMNNWHVWDKMAMRDISENDEKAETLFTNQKKKKGLIIC